ncbi:MAG TPA: protein kinase [Gemmatimonadaceae bacterium]|nr:protein kinase [Gemmatimonadaceae bacterium]
MTETLTAAELQPSLADRYTIERELGHGGMATVYLARDLKHGRDVAIKVLSPDLARSIASERFLREIGIAARLNHPHVLPLLDSGVAGAAELPYYVMPLVTGESLRDRLRRDGRLPLDESLRLAAEVADALAYAHEHQLVHRDVKPDNVLLSGGHAVVMDFGIAKAVGDAREASTLTGEGMSLGTPAYMAPEQAAAEHTVDHRADIYAVGAMLFEMLGGAAPFAGSWQQIVMEKMAKDAPSLASRWPDAPAPVVRLVARCLARDPDARPQTAAALLQELHALAAPAPARSRGRLAAVSLVALAALGVAGGLYLRNRSAWVRAYAIPNVERLIEADQLDSAFALASEAEARAPRDSALALLWPRFSRTQIFLSEPAGADVKRAALSDTTRWIPVGTTPTSAVRIPSNAWYYRYSKSGYRDMTVMGARLGGSYVPIPSPIPLRRLNDPDTDMVLLRGAGLAGTLYGLNNKQKFDLPDFLIDAREVTNHQYKAFVDAGGYGNRALWDSTIVRDGKPVAWDDAMRLFVDRSGRPGPASWEGGAPPADGDELPVGGVSWYEARAYARFVKKELPTVYEWNAAAMPEAARWVVPHGRYDAAGPVRGGDQRGVSPRGVYDMAGNVREWIVNAREPGSRYILGGGWSDPQYLFSEIYAQPELDRSPINGIRLVRRSGTSPDLASASAPIPQRTRDYASVRPVDDATFRAFVALYDYDHTPLNAKVVARDSSAPDWVREEIQFDVPGDSLRMIALLFLPRHVAAPFQTVVIFPASDAQFLHDYHRPSMSVIDYIVRSGRAVLYPIYEHTYGRGSATDDDSAPATIAHRDQMIRWAREMRRSIDYVASRPDIDSTRIGFAGTSWGGRLSGVMLALEPRIRVAVLNVPGLSMSTPRPEEDPVNFLPRVHIPVLMLSGKYDSSFPLELSQKPFFQLLGSPPGMKKHVLDEGGHFLPRPMMVREALAWLDQYLGPVQRR